MVSLTHPWTGAEKMAQKETETGHVDLRQAMQTAIDVFQRTQARSAVNWREALVSTLHTLDAASEETASLRAKLGVEHSVRTTTKAPVDVAIRDTYLVQLERAVNKAYAPKDENSVPVTLPTDYKIFLSITEGIQNPNLDEPGVSGVNGVKDTKIEAIAPADVERLPMAHSLCLDGWDIRTGFLLGQGDPPQHNWLVYYYCARGETTARGPKANCGEIQAHEREWKWRIFYKEPERFGLSFLDPMAFDGLLAWLAWYQEWWHRESVTYPAWTAQSVRAVELLYPDDTDQLGEDGLQ